MPQKPPTLKKPPAPATQPPTSTPPTASTSSQSVNLGKIERGRATQAASRAARVARGFTIPTSEIDSLDARYRKLTKTPIPKFTEPAHEAVRAMSTNHGTRNQFHQWLQSELRTWRNMLWDRSVTHEQRREINRAALDPAWRGSGADPVVDRIARYYKRILKGAEERIDLDPSLRGRVPKARGQYLVTFKGNIDAHHGPTTLDFPTAELAQEAQEILGKDWQVIIPTSSEQHIPSLVGGSSVQWYDDSGQFPDIDPPGFMEQVAGKPFFPPLTPAERSLMEYAKLAEEKYLRDSTGPLVEMVKSLKEAAEVAQTSGEGKLAQDLRHLEVTMRRQLQGVQGMNSAQLIAETVINKIASGSVGVLNWLPGVNLSVPHVVDPLGRVFNYMRTIDNTSHLSGPTSVLNRFLELPMQVAPHTGLTDLPSIIESGMTSKGRRNRAMLTDAYGLGLGTSMSVDPRNASSTNPALIGYRWANNSEHTSAIQALNYWRWREGDRPAFMARVDPSTPTGRQRRQFVEKLSEYEGKHQARLDEHKTSGRTLAELERADAERIFGPGNVRYDAQDAPNDGTATWLHKQFSEGWIPIGDKLESKTLEWYGWTMGPRIPGYRMPFVQAHPFYSQYIGMYREPAWRQRGNVIRIFQEAWNHRNYRPLLRYMGFRFAHNGIMPLARFVDAGSQAVGLDLNLDDEGKMFELLKSMGVPEEARPMIVAGLGAYAGADMSRGLDAALIPFGQGHTFAGQYVDENSPLWAKLLHQILSDTEEEFAGSDVPRSLYAIVSALWALDEHVPKELRAERTTKLAMKQSGALRTALAANEYFTGDEPINARGLTQREKMGKLTPEGERMMSVDRTMLDALNRRLQAGPYSDEDRKKVSAAIEEADSTGKLRVDELTPLFGERTIGNMLLGGDIKSSVWRDWEAEVRRENARVQSYLSRRAIAYSERLRKEWEGNPPQVAYDDWDVQLELSIAMNEWYADYGRPEDWPQQVSGKLGNTTIGSTPEQYKRLRFFVDELNRANGFKTTEQ